MFVQSMKSSLRTTLASSVKSPISRFSLDIIHNAPSSDPRWDSAPSGAKLGAVTSSLRIETQLFEKLKAHTMFLDFVHEVIQDRAPCKVSRKGLGIADLLHVIVEHNDKLVAAWHLCKLQEVNNINGRVVSPEAFSGP